jgi:hypothetical protein
MDGERKRLSGIDASVTRLSFRRNENMISLDLQMRFAQLPSCAFFSPSASFSWLLQESKLHSRPLS